ncbi:Gfo/Idh/MocA family oxidoreductase [soil metagenome]
MPTNPLRWGFVGPGRIAAKVADELGLSRHHILHAVASRSIERARTFANDHGGAVAYGSYGELLVDPEVDAVYITTPHRQHHAIALATIDAGKHLLVEKAFTCTTAGTVEVVEAARTAGVFCMEAMWSRFLPAYARLRELIDAGAIGEVRAVRADLGRVTAFDDADRLWDAAQGGGALLDLGVYPVSFVQWVLGGSPEGAVQVVGATAPNGVDAEAALLWDAGDGRSGFAHCSLRSPLPGTAAVFGTDGWIEIPPRLHHPERLLVYPADDAGRAPEPRVEQAPPAGAGYVHEFDEVYRCVAAGRTESTVMPLDDTIAVMRILEAGLHALDVHYDEAAVEL